MKKTYTPTRYRCTNQQTDWADEAIKAYNAGLAQDDKMDRRVRGGMVWVIALTFGSALLLDRSPFTIVCVGLGLLMTVFLPRILSPKK